MACYHPAKAYRCADGSVVFAQLARFDIVGDIRLPCGQCIGCRIDRSREWAARCMHEAQMHEQNAFLTLTYDDEHLPANCSLDYRHFQLFMKRLRKAGAKPRFFMCGEYGDNTFRPHYHCLLFGHRFDDLRHWKLGSTGFPIYTSVVANQFWKLGNVYIGEVSRQSAGYVARYCMKKVNGDLAAEHYGDRQPEFARMSLKPGIGSTWFARYGADVLPCDYVVADGIKVPVPRYYDKLFKGDIDDVKFNREQYARKFADNSTDERLEVREQVAKARLKSLVRDKV